jgi:OOP family OmpA-OmpF porin
MMKKSKGVVAAAFAGVALAFSAPVFAQSQADRGWYAGGSLGQMEAKGSCPGGFNCDFKDTAWKLFGGYRINRNFAAEVFYANLGKITVSATVPGVGTVSSESKVTSFGAAALGIWPVGEQFEVFGKLGIASTDHKTTGTGPGVTISGSGSGSDILFGVGASYNFTRSLALRAEWERFNDSEVNVMSIGVQYKF